MAEHHKVAPRRGDDIGHLRQLLRRCVPWLELANSDLDADGKLERLIEEVKRASNFNGDR